MPCKTKHAALRVEFSLINRKGERVFHFQWIENSRLEEFLNRLFRGCLNDVSEQNITRVAVIVLFPGLKIPLRFMLGEEIYHVFIECRFFGIFRSVDVPMLLKQVHVVWKPTSVMEQVPNRDAFVRKRRQMFCDVVVEI